MIMVLKTNRVSKPVEIRRENVRGDLHETIERQEQEETIERRDRDKTRPKLFESRRGATNLKSHLVSPFSNIS